MKYAGIIKNDIANGKNVCVSFWTQGCPFHCPGCHNPETWSFEGGMEFTANTMSEILTALTANSVQRNFSILGGEPLCLQNRPLVKHVLTEVRKMFPDILVFIWTGYTYEDIQTNPDIQEILTMADYLIDGRFDITQRDITLPLRGSSNQRIIRLDKNKKI